MSVVAQLYDCTKHLHEHLQEELPEKERDAYIHRIEDLLEQRETLIAQGSMNNLMIEDRQIVEDLLLYDRRVQARLAFIYKQIRSDVGGIRRQKATNARYAPRSPGPSMDGMFLDQRK